MSTQPAINPAKLSSGPVKGSNTSQAISGPSLTQQVFTNDLGARRSTSTTSVNRQAAPRKDQDNKVKHKGGKKFRPSVVDEDGDAERFSMQNPHGRRGQQSITHLMNFALPPRPTNHSSQRHTFRRDHRVNQTWGLGSGYHATDKARYIHANYRFIVDPRGDYQAQAHDADIHLDWNNVLQVIASSKSQQASCPICLGHPTAPRMAKCGHIFCLPCLIRYMNSDDTSQTTINEKRARWKKCPICWDSVYISETRPLRWYTGQEHDIPQEGQDIVLRLVTRKQGRTLATPRESDDIIAAGDDVPWYFATDAIDYSRVLKGSEEYMIEQYDQAIVDVKQLEQEDELMFGEDSEWTSRAIRSLRESKESVKGMGNPPTIHHKPQQIARSDDAAQPNQSDPTSVGSPEQNISQEPYVPRTLTEMRDRALEKPQPNEYLFYHALQHYYLSPLDIRILKTAFGSYESFPSSILSRVERVSAGHIVDDELRKRVKYLGHLPYGCEVAFLECDWTDTVAPEVLQEFLPLLQKRRKRHDEKEAREEKERIRIEKAGERELAEIRRKRPSISENAFRGDLPPGHETDGSVNLGTSLRSSTTGMSPPWGGRATAGFSSLATHSTSPSMPRTVWGTTAIASTSPELNAAVTGDGFAEGDGWLQGWEKDLLDHREEQLVGDLEGLSLSGVPVKTTGPKKGKKGKKITLMSTTARRGA